MIAWIIISACLYLIGMFPAYWLAKKTGSDLFYDNEEYIIMIAWPIAYLFKLAGHLFNKKSNKNEVPDSNINRIN